MLESGLLSRGLHERWGLAIGGRPVLVFLDHALKVDSC